MNPFLIPRYIRGLQTQLENLGLYSHRLEIRLSAIEKTSELPRSKYIADELIPEEDIPILERIRSRTSAKEYGVRASVEHKLAPTPEHLEIREFSNRWDIGCVTDEWITDPCAEIGLEYSIFKGVEVARLENYKVVVFYALNIQDKDRELISRLIVRDGGVVGNIRHSYDLEHTKGKLYFNTPILFLCNRPFCINVVSREKSLDHPFSVKLFGYTFEPKGRHITGE